MAQADDFPQVLEAARMGAEWAWNVLYRDLSPPVLRYFRAGGASEPEDLTGEVFVHLVTGLGRFEGAERDFRAWVFTIAHRRLIDARRRAARGPSVPAPAEDITRAGPVGNAEDEALEEVQRARVERVLARLTPDQRDVLMLRILADLSVEETARAVGKSPGAVKALQSRGLSALRRAIASEAVSI